MGRVRGEHRCWYTVMKPCCAAFSSTGWWKAGCLSPKVWAREMISIAIRNPIVFSNVKVVFLVDHSERLKKMPITILNTKDSLPFSANICLMHSISWIQLYKKIEKMSFNIQIWYTHWSWSELKLDEESHFHYHKYFWFYLQGKKKNHWTLKYWTSFLASSPPNTFSRQKTKKKLLTAMSTLPVNLKLCIKYLVIKRSISSLKAICTKNIRNSEYFKLILLHSQTNTQSSIWRIPICSKR